MPFRSWLLALSALALVPVLPLLPRLGDSFFGLAGEGRGEFENWWWFHWWIHRLLEFHAQDATGPLDLAQRILSIPQDLDIGNMADILFVSYPLEAVFGVPAFHNLKVVLVLVGNALAAGVLARSLGAERQALYVTAAGLALSPFLWTELEECRMGQAILAFAFLGAAAWLRLLQDPTPRRGALFGLALGVTAVFYWFYGLWLAMWCLLTLRPVKPGALVTAALVAGAVSLPFLSPYVAQGSKSPVPLGRPFPPLQGLPRLPEGQLGPIGPSLILAQSLPPAWPLDPREPHGVALTWLALAALGARKASLRWLVPAAAFWLLSLGPYLRWGDDYVDLPLPYTLLYQWLPAWSRLNWPWRVAPFLFLSLAPLVLEGARRFRRPAAAFTVLLLLELALRGTLFLTASPAAPSPFYATLGPQEGVVELSYPWNSSMAAYQQAFHGRPTLGTEALAWPHYGPPRDSLLGNPRAYAQEPFLAWLERVRQGPAGPAPPPDVLVEAGYKWVVIHLSEPGGADLAARVEEGLGRWDYRDESVAAWRLEGAEEP